MLSPESQRPPSALFPFQPLPQRPHGRASLGIGLISQLFSNLLFQSCFVGLSGLLFCHEAFLD
jgi:hypothetical protein